MGPVSEIQGSPQWQGAFLLFSCSWLLISVLRGWANGLMRQLMAVVAFLGAAFLVFHGSSQVADYLLRGIPQVFQIPTAALLIWLVSYSGIGILGRFLFKRTRDQDSPAVKIICGAGGALIGFAYGLFFIWSLAIGLRVTGRIAENQIGMQRTAGGPAGEFALNVAKLKNSVELGVGRPLVDAFDPVPPSFYRELTQYSRLAGNPRTIRLMLEYPGFRGVSQDPRIVELERDPEILAYVQSGNLLGIFSHRKVVALLSDPHLRKVFSLRELKAALDYAGNSANDGQQQ